MKQLMGLSFDILKKIFDILKKIYSLGFVRIFPAKIITSVLGTGHLPEWQGHWASLLGVLFSVFIAYIFTGFVGSIVDLSIPIVVAAIILFVIGLLSIHLSHLKDSGLDDEIMIHIFFGQVLVCGLSGPAVLSIGADIIVFNSFICEKFLYCAPWFYTVITYLPLFMIPYFVYRCFDMLKPWPASILDRDYNNSISNMSDALVNAFYTLVTLYLSAFIFFHLTIDSAILFFQGISNSLRITNLSTPQINTPI